MWVPQVLIKKQIIESIYQITYHMNLKIKFLMSVQETFQKKYLSVNENYRYKI